ncbi:carbohydrate binding domain-containing protein [Paenibacillus puerhi]|uniref:carbohydrate binding domain-containing protein n=1 Tax=Paenibacillus puerhi TaxID=2692622 RepID=UPI0013589E0C|nr:carbohydrate binding domain-containing protein [Paenibacillus puerhi]
MIKRISFIIGLISLILIAPSNANALSVQYFYDQNGKLLTSFLPSVGSISYKYDKNGNLLKKQLDGNLLFNGGFERYTEGNGVADGWRTSVTAGVVENYQISSASSSGERAQQMKVTNVPVGGRAYLYQDASVEENKDYVFSSQINITELTKAKVVYSLSFMGENGGVVGGQSKELNTKTQGYTTLTFAGTIPANTTWARLHVYIEALDGIGAGTFYLDAVDLYYGKERNLLFNGGFERYTEGNGVADGWRTSVTAGVVENYQVSSASSSGEKAQQMKVTNVPVGGRAYLYQDASVEENKDYVFSSQINITELTKAKVVYSLSFMGENGGVVGRQSKELNTKTQGYTTLTFAGTIPANTTWARLHVYIEALDGIGAGTFYLDAVGLYYGKERNLLFNGGFERYTEGNGVADGWRTSVTAGVVENYQVSSASSSGEKAQQMKVTNVPVGGRAYLYQDASVEENKDYVFSSQINITELTKAKVVYSLSFMDGNGGVVGGQTKELNTKTQGYTTLTFAGTIPANTTWARLHVYIEALEGNGAGTFYLDAVGLYYGKERYLLFNGVFER